MKRIGWAIALAAAWLTPAAAYAQAPAAAPAASAAQQPEGGFAQDPNRADAATAPVSEQSVGAGPTTAATPPDSLGAFKETPASNDLGVPILGKRGIQEQVTPIGREAATFHNVWLLLLCAAISIFVLALLLYAIIRFRRGANPVPSRNSHNTAIEVIWTLVPVLILVAIAIPSIKLLRNQYSPPPADVTVKVIGHQWYWTYELPDHGVSFDSYMLKEANDPTRQANQRARTDADGPPLLAVDQRLVIPVGKVVKFIVTADDVIHSFAVPAFWVKQDANPGQLHETWVKVDRPGVYFGQCSELCGARHAYMPIAVEAVPEAQFAAWVASKGGQMPAPRRAAAPAPARPGGTDTDTVTPAPAAAGTQRPASPAAGPNNTEVANRATAND
ncbi:MAG TPA: cytochrome c oxidase subunit II [Sphingomicrobium sp.]|nr:cytochrome c oxidase subunit II [Sphingomicrobium sp.]